MTYPALERRKQKHDRELAVKFKLAEIWEEASSLEQFFLEASVKAPEAKKLDLLAARGLQLKKSYRKLWNFCFPASIASCVAWLLLSYTLLNEKACQQIFGDKILCYSCMSVLAAFPILFYFLERLATGFENLVWNSLNRNSTLPPDV